MTFMLYMAEIMPRLGGFFIVLTLVGLIISCIVFACRHDGENQDGSGEKLGLAPFVVVFAITCFFGTLAFLIPSKQTMHLMIAAHVIEEKATDFVGSPLYNAIVKNLTGDTAK